MLTIAASTRRTSMAASANQPARTADQTPPPAAPPSSSVPSRTLADMAGQDSGQPSDTLLYAATAAPLTPAQQQARQHNEALRRQLDPADWNEVLYQVGRNFGNNAYRNGIVYVDEAHAARADRRTKKFNVGPTPDPQARMDPAAAAQINTQRGTRIDFNELASYEGGQATQGYLPWWPHDIRVNPHGAIRVDTTTETVNGRDMLKGSSRSGVTVGTGVDLGQQDPATYTARLQQFGAPQALIDQLEPYMGLKRGQAAEYLRTHPLTLTKAEADLLDAEMKDHHLQSAIKAYDDLTRHIQPRREFKDLSMQEQTVLLSRHYQDGNITNTRLAGPRTSRKVAQALARGEVAEALKLLNTSHYTSSAHANRVPKEHNYLNEWFKTMDAEAYKVQAPQP